MELCDVNIVVHCGRGERLRVSRRGVHQIRHTVTVTVTGWSGEYGVVWMRVWDMTVQH